MATKAERIVKSILDDLEGRKGLGDEWYQIDEDIQFEIIAIWEKIVKNIFDDPE